LPLVLVICGVGASGKSTLAAELAARSRLPHFSSDVLRKQLAGVPVEQRAPAYLYGPAPSDRTYAELANRAEAAVGSHGGAIVDATFSRRAQRQLLMRRLERSGTRILWIACEAPPQVLRSRAATRERGAERGSDATWPVIAAQLEAREPLDDIAPASRHRIYTDRPLDACLDAVDRFVSATVDPG
jgi:uncharacterized protein